MGEANLACFPEDAVRVCKLSGAELKLRQSQLLTLRDCEETLVQALREAEAARSSYAFFRAAEIAARIVLVTCDIAIMALETATGPGGVVVAKAYGGSKLVVDALSGNVDQKTGAMLLLDNKASIAAMSAKHMGSAKVATAIDATKNLISLADTLWGQVTGALDGAGGGAGIDSGIASVKNQLARIQQKIAQLQIDLENC